MQLVAVVVAVLAAVVVLTLGYWRHVDHVGAASSGRLTDELVGLTVAERVVVSMTSGDGFAGLLVAADPRTLKLRDAMGVSRTGDRAPVDGEVLIPRAEVAYLQRPAG